MDATGSPEFSIVGFLIGLFFKFIIPILIIGFIAFMGAVITPEAEVRIVQRFGRFHRILRPGLSFIIPFVDEIAGVISLKIQQLKVDVSIVTSDRANLTTPVAIQYQVEDDEVDIRNAFYMLTDATKQIPAYVENVARSKGNQMTMTDIFKSTDDIKKELALQLESKFKSFGYKVTDAQVTSPHPSAKVKDAFDDVIASQQRMEAAKNDAAANITKKVGEATAESQSVAIKTETFKQQRKAIAETIKGLVEDLETTGVTANRALSYLEGIDYRDTIRDASANPGTTILMPMQLDGVTGTVAINESLKNKS